MGCSTNSIKVKENPNKINNKEVNKIENNENIKKNNKIEESNLKNSEIQNSNHVNNDNSEKKETENKKIINQEKIEEEKRKKEEEEKMKKLAEEEKIKREEEEKKKKEEEEERLKREEEERLKKEEEERLKKEEEEKKKKEEEEMKKKEEEERKKKEEEEKKKKEEEERLKKEEEERLKKEEEEKKKKEEEEEKKKKEEEEKKKKEEEERKKKEEEKNTEDDEEFQKLKKEELSRILPSDQKNPSKSCVFLGLHGNFFTDKQKALDRINAIRKEACNEGVKDPATKKKFKPSDYKPMKWSTELEFVSRIRAAEAVLTIGHERLNGKDIWSVAKDGIRSWGENLAWNWDNANSIDMINQWYREKKDWVTGGKGVTGHYESLISSRYSYVGLGWFNTTCSQYPSCLAGSFASNTVGENFIEEKKDIIQTIDVLKNNIQSYYLEGKKIMKTNEIQTLTPRIKLKNPSLSVWPLNRYELSFSSNNQNIAKVHKSGKIEALKAGNIIITCKNPDKTNFATFNIEIKCEHEKKLIKTIDSTCTKTGTNTYQCDICNTKLDLQIKMKPHDYKFVYSKGKSTGTCTQCKKVIQCNPPTEFEIYWRNEQTTEASSYWSCVPDKNPIGSSIVGWVHKINGDSDYRELVAECDNEDVLELPTDKIREYVNLKVIGEGHVTLTVYSKYNTTLKHSYQLNLGN